jgi:hypothetical protein
MNNRLDIPNRLIRIADIVWLNNTELLPEDEFVL